jgi:superfamily II DNA or RNA helicase
MGATATMELRLGACVSIPRRLIPDHRWIEMCHDLTIEPEVSEKYGFGKKGDERPVIIMFKDDGDWVRVPRQYALEKFPDMIRDYGLTDETSKGTPVKWNWVGDAEHDRRAAALGKPDWSGRQRAWVDAIYKAIMESPVKGTIGEAPTSFGKTVCTMRLLSLLGRTALVLVHKDFLLGQWTKAAVEWGGLKPEEIGIIKGDRWDFEGKKLVIGMVETLNSRIDAIPDALLDWPGVICGDEVHRLGSVQWSRIMPLFRAEVRFGVSATPRRKDGLDRVFRWTIGPVSAREKEWSVKPTVYQIAWPVFIEENKYAVVRYNAATGESRTIKTFLAVLENKLCDLPKYNEWLVGEIIQAAEKGRMVMVLSSRRNHLEVLKRGFDAATGGRFKTAFYWAAKNKAERQEQERAGEMNVLFGTFGKAKEALDIPGLDTLFLTVPKADVEQDVGRILRVDPDKKPPLVVDVVHVGIPVAEEFAKKRRRWYASKGFEVNLVGRFPQGTQPT